MTLREDRRRTPWLHFVLLLTCVMLGGIIAAQQQIITNQSNIIRLLSGDSSELAAVKMHQLNHANSSSAK